MRSSNKANKDARHHQESGSRESSDYNFTLTRGWGEVIDHRHRVFGKNIASSRWKQMNPYVRKGTTEKLTDCAIVRLQVHGSDVSLHSSGINRWCHCRACRGIKEQLCDMLCTRVRQFPPSAQPSEPTRYFELALTIHRPASGQAPLPHNGSLQYSVPFPCLRARVLHPRFGRRRPVVARHTYADGLTTLPIPF